MKKVNWVLVFAIAVIVILVLVAANKDSGQEDAEVESQDGSNETADIPSELQIANLVSIEPFTGNGTATRAFEEERFVHTVSANLNDPPAGKFYEGWLVEKEPTLRFFSTGRLEKTTGEYFLSYIEDINERNFTEFNDVVITQETEANGLDGVPEDHVLEGSF